MNTLLTSTPARVATLLTIGSICSVGSVSAQQQPAPSAALTPPITAADWLVPIHTQADDPEGGAYGTWATGPDYKVSFDDGMTFYPVLGADRPENLPWRWRTHAVTSGSHRLDTLAGAPRTAADGWRYTLDYAGFKETYDVLSAGVEQRFEFASHPAGVGATSDLVITGAIDSPLQSMPVEAGVQSLTFTDHAGVAIVGYGKALAFDAAGHTTPVTTSFDGDRIQLTVSGAWLQDAQWPVTVDPLTTSLVVANGGSLGIANYPAIARDIGNGQLMVTYSRPTSGSDYDLFCRLQDDLFIGLGTIFADVNASWSTRYSSVAFAGSKWGIAFGRNFVANAAVRVYVHDAGNTVRDSGTLYFSAPPIGFSDQFPSIGGVTQITSTPRCYLVYQRDANEAGTNSPNGRNSEVFGRQFNLDTGVFSGESEMNTGNPTDVDDEWPQITAERGLNDSWVVVWQSYNYGNSNDDWDALGQLVDQNGVRRGLANLGQGTPTLHSLHPNVAGRDGRYMVSFLRRSNTLPFSHFTGTAIMARRFDWPNGVGGPTSLQAPREISSAGTNALRANLSRSIAFGTDTDSHWAVAYRTTANAMFVARVGYTGQVVERARASAIGISTASAGLCYDSVTNSFPMVYGLQNASFQLVGQHFEFSPDATATNYGMRCRGLITAGLRGRPDEPHAGSEFWGVNLQSGVALAPTALLAAFGNGSTPLPLGGCTLLLDTASLVTVIFGLSDGSGDFSLPVSLPDSIPSADVYWQYIQLDAGVIRASNGLHSQIR